jgi:hypothetical protein
VVSIPVVIIALSVPPSPICGLVPARNRVEVSILLMSFFLPSPISRILTIIPVVVVSALAIIVSATAMFPTIVVVVPFFLKI